MAILAWSGALIPAQTIGAGGITNTNTSDYVLTGNVTLGANQTWDAQAGDIVVSGNVNGNYKALTVTGAHDTTLSGVLSNLAYSNGLVKSGSGTLFLAGNNTFSGPINVSSGTVQLSHDNALGGSAWGNTVQSGGALALSNDITVNQGSFSLGGSGTGTGSLVNVSGNNTFNSSITLTADAVFTSQQDTLTLSQAILQGNYDLTLQGAGNWNVTGQMSANSGGTLFLTGDGTTNISGNVNVGGGVVIDNHGSTTISSSLNLGSGALTIQGNSNATLTGGQVNASGGLVIADNASASISNALNLGGADITLSSAGVVELSGSQINVGDITLSGSGSTTFDSQINASSFTQTGSGTTTFSGTGNNYFGSVSLQGGTVIANQDGVAFHTNNLTMDNVDVEFGSDNQIPTWTSVVLHDNVSLMLNGTTQVWDQLTVTGNSSIDFAGGDGTLTIGSLVVDPGAVLTILNWDPNNFDTFIAGIDPGSSTPHIVFSGGGGATWDPFTGEIIPGAIVPEPESYGGLVMLLSMSAWYLHTGRRRK